MQISIQFDQIEDQYLEIPFNQEAGNVLVHVSNPAEDVVQITVTGSEDAETVIDLITYLSDTIRAYA